MITSLGKGRVNLSAFSTFVRFVLVWICRLPLPLDVWEGLRFVIVALSGLVPYLLFYIDWQEIQIKVEKIRTLDVLYINMILDANEKPNNAKKIIIFLFVLF